MSRFARHGHRDANHAAIEQAMNRLGVCTLDLSALGHGCPDIAATGGKLGSQVWLVEVKNPNNYGGKRGVQPRQADWMARWPGPTRTLWTVAETVAWLCGPQEAPDRPQDAPGVDVRAGRLRRRG